MEKVRIFVSYSRQDDSRWFDEGSLIPYLARAVRNEAEFWVDRGGIEAGEDFRKRIEAEIDRAHLAILLVSQGFLSSEFIQDIELPRIRERVERGELQVLPILTEPCGWDEVEFFFSRQMVPGKPTPLSDYVKEDSDWRTVRNEIRKALNRLIARIGERPKPPPTNEVLFRSLVEAAAADGEISPKETEFLLSQASQLGLTEDHANKTIDEFRVTVETNEKPPQPKPHEEETETPPVTPVMEAEPDPQEPASPTRASERPATPDVASVTTSTASQPVETKESIPGRRSARVTPKNGVKTVEFNPAFIRPFEESIPGRHSARVTANNGTEYVVRELVIGSRANRSFVRDYVELSQGGARLKINLSDVAEGTFLWREEAKRHKFSTGHGYVFITERNGKTVEGSVYGRSTFAGTDGDGHPFDISLDNVKHIEFLEMQISSPPRPARSALSNVAHLTGRNGEEYVVKKLRRGSSANRSVRHDCLELSQGGARLRLELSDIDEATFLWGKEAKGHKFSTTAAGMGYVFITERSGKIIEGSVYGLSTFVGTDADGHEFQIPLEKVTNLRFQEDDASP